MMLQRFFARFLQCSHRMIASFFLAATSYLYNMKSFFLSAMMLMSYIAIAQHGTKIYNPNADAKADIRKAVAIAAKERKHVLLQVGGNWCIWCTRFHNLVESNDTLSRLLHDNYVVVPVNYSPENKNEAVLAELGYPQRFGYPVFVILDGKGRRIHTQNSGYLEEGKGHSVQKVAEFLEQWTVKAVDPATYK